MQCAFEGSKAAASAGGAAGVPGLLGAAAAVLGLRKLSNWLAAHGHTALSPKRLKVATGVVTWVFVLALYGVSF